MKTPTHDDWIQAGRIAAEVLAYGKSLIKPGVKLVTVADACDQKMVELGARPAFPSQISCNEIAAHFCPDEDEEATFDTQVVSLDVGACYNGAIGDNAVTIDLGGHHTELVKASKEALNNVASSIQIGTTLGEIGKTVQETIQSHGFAPVRNLSGHGLAPYNVHDTPTVPNYDNGDNTPLQQGMKIAIEPFASAGKGLIYESSPPTIFSLVQKRPTRNPFARQILAKIDTYHGMPFTTRWISQEFGKLKAQLVIKELLRNGSLHAYPPLPDAAPVSQAEHTFLIEDKVVISTKIE